MKGHSAIHVDSDKAALQNEWLHTFLGTFTAHNALLCTVYYGFNEKHYVIVRICPFFLFFFYNVYIALIRL